MIEKKFKLDILNREWKKELSSAKKPSLARALVRIFGFKIFLLGLLISVEVILILLKKKDISISLVDLLLRKLPKWLFRF